MSTLLSSQEWDVFSSLTFNWNQPQRKKVNNNMQFPSNHLSRSRRISWLMALKSSKRLSKDKDGNTTTIPPNSENFFFEKMFYKQNLHKTKPFTTTDIFLSSYLSPKFISWTLYGVRIYTGLTYCSTIVLL